METINIPGVGDYDNSIPFNSQTLAVKQWGLDLIYSGGNCTADELCGTNVNNQEVRRPTERCYTDMERGLVLMETIHYNTETTAPNALQYSKMTYQLNEL